MVPEHRVPPVILVVDHSEPSRTKLAQALHASGFDVHEAARGEDAYVRLGETPIQLVLVNLNLPGGAGLAICRRLGGVDNLRIVAIGGPQDETDAVVALEMGADDYVPKATGHREIAARVRAHLRRASPPGRGATTLYRFQGLRFDVLRRRLWTSDGALAPLTYCQASLLAAFLNSDGRVLSREELLGFLRGEGVKIMDRTVDRHISRLRERLSELGGAHMISTVHGQGYRWLGGPVIVNSGHEPARQLDAPPGRSAA